MAILAARSKSKKASVCPLMAAGRHQLIALMMLSKAKRAISYWPSGFAALEALSLALSYRGFGHV